MGMFPQVKPTEPARNSDVNRNRFTYDMNSDWVAVTVDGEPIARGLTKEAVMRAEPDAQRYLCAADFEAAAEQRHVSVANYLATPMTHAGYAVLDANDYVVKSGYAPVDEVWSHVRGAGRCMVGFEKAPPEGEKLDRSGFFDIAKTYVDADRHLAVLDGGKSSKGGI